MLPGACFSVPVIGSAGEPGPAKTRGAGQRFRTGSAWQLQDDVLLCGQAKPEAFQSFGGSGSL